MALISRQALLLTVIAATFAFWVAVSSHEEMGLTGAPENAQPAEVSQEGTTGKNGPLEYIGGGTRTVAKENLGPDRNEITDKRSQGSQSRRLQDPLRSALQSDLELIGPDSNFEEAVRAFSAEAIDPAWSQATEAQILRTVSQVSGLTLADVQVQCRSTTCRVRMSNAKFAPRASFANFGDLVDSLGLEVTWIWMGPDKLGNREDLAYIRK